MGQRLNFEVCYDGEVLANAYYHWSAYTSSSLGILENVIEAYKNRTEINPLRVAVEILQATGAGINDEEKSRIRMDKSGKFDGIKFHDAVDRNEGLLFVTLKGIEDTRKWEEGRVTVDISTEEFRFDVMWIESNEEYEEYREPGDAAKLPYMDDVGIDITEPCSLWECDKLAKIIRNNPDGIRIDDETIWCWIE